jgi:serine/threonine-protein kinase
MLPSPGDLVDGKYRIVRLIGEGGMGVVYEARHEHLGTSVALKFLHPDLAQRPVLVARFLQEARVSASIKSPHVTQVIDVDQTPEGAAYLVMELLEGESLEKRLERGAPLPIAEAVDIAVQILSALEVAHREGIVHRDLKPDNVWLTPAPSGPHVKLLDFGIAKLKRSAEFRAVTTRPGSMMGTPAYMAPEQAISADQVDQRADLYSLGVILYETLCGSRPVDAEEPQQILERLVRGEVHPLRSKNPNVPPALASIVDRMVAPNPDERPPSAEAVKRELVEYARSGAERGGFPVDRASRPVAHTLPPDDAGPPFTARASAVPLALASTEPARTATAFMPARPEFSPAPAMAAPAPASPRRSRRALWIALAVAGAAAGAGLWAYMNPSVFEDDAAPPLPGPSPSAETVPAVLDAGVEGDPSRARRRERRTATEHPNGRPEVTGTPLPLPTLPALPFPLPSTLPIPPGLIPSGLPPFLPQIPGVTVPTAGTAPSPSAPAAAPPPSSTPASSPR